jgi:hypothetical protein
VFREVCPSRSKTRFSLFMFSPHEPQTRIPVKVFVLLSARARTARLHRGRNVDRQPFDALCVLVFGKRPCLSPKCVCPCANLERCSSRLSPVCLTMTGVAGEKPWAIAHSDQCAHCGFLVSLLVLHCQGRCAGMQGEKVLTGVCFFLSRHIHTQKERYHTKF